MICNGIIVSMKLPNRKKAIIERKKLTHYLLDVMHPVGGLKAKFFRGIGFDDTNADQFEQELYKIAQNNDVKDQRSSENSSGINYMVVGSLNAPNGKIYSIETVWYIKAGAQDPSFITAYPV